MNNIYWIFIDCTVYIHIRAVQLVVVTLNQDIEPNCDLLLLLHCYVLLISLTRANVVAPFLLCGTNLMSAAASSY